MSEPGELETLESARKSLTVSPVPLTEASTRSTTSGMRATRACACVIRSGSCERPIKGVPGRAAVAAAFCEFRSTSAEAS